MEYSQTVNLPRTNFSMKANLVQKEPQFLKMWEAIGIYKKQLEKEASRLLIFYMTVLLMPMEKSM